VFLYYIVLENNTTRTFSFIYIPLKLYTINYILKFAQIDTTFNVLYYI